MEPLSPEEVRVLGCLAEKQLATPQHYPLTENALITACNQTTNRDPVVAYGQSVVRPTLISLREQGLAKRVRRTGERTEKHAHRLDETLGLEPGPLAVLAVLLLRGPQTPGELKGRTDRLHRFADAEDLDAALGDLADRGLVERLPRRPGEKQARWRHRLSGDAPEEPAVTAPPAETAQGAQGAPVPTLRALADEVAALRERVSALEAELGVAPPAGPSPGAGAGGEEAVASGAGGPILDPDTEDGGR
jgi:uncharacterized protein